MTDYPISQVFLEGVSTIAQLNVAQTFTAVQTFKGIISLGAYSSNVVTKTTTYTVASTDEVVIADGTSAAFTVTLPAANAQTGRKIMIIKKDSSANAITVSRAGSDTIEGATTRSLASQYNKIGLVSDGSSVWYDLGTGGQ